MKQIQTLLVLGLMAPALMLGSTGCQTAGEHKVLTGTAIGTAAGALAGGVIGHQSGNRNQGALIGAAVGAAVGAGTGYWLDKRAKRLETVESPGVEVMPYPETAPPQGSMSAPIPEHITLRLSDTMLFEKGSSTINPQGAAKLNEIAALLKEQPEERIIIRGYTSSEGGDALNVDLSKRRAEMVANQLVGSGVNPGRITPVGMGSSNPIASNETEAGRAQNRRVEIEVFPANQG